MCACVCVCAMRCENIYTHTHNDDDDDKNNFFKDHLKEINVDVLLCGKNDSKKSKNLPTKL